MRKEWLKSRFSRPQAPWAKAAGNFYHSSKKIGHARNRDFSYRLFRQILSRAAPKMQKGDSHLQSRPLG
ncbi:hypothetical protein EMIT0P2_40282 [Pseudomonas sp. IT-P2]